MQTSTKLGMMGDYKFVYHNHFCVKNWYGKTVNLLSYSYQRITTRSCKIYQIHCYQDVIHQNCHSSIYLCFLITRWNLNSYRAILWIWNVCINSMVCITVEFIPRQYGMCHCGVYVKIVWYVSLECMCRCGMCHSGSIINTQCQCSTSVPATQL